MIPITRVLCPVDFSDTSQHAVDHAAAIADWYQARLTLLHVFVTLPTSEAPPLILDDATRECLETSLRRMAAGVPPGLSLDIRLEQAEHVHRGVLDHLAASHADLLVLGTHGRSGFERFFLGSVTEKVIRKATCPTLVVPPRSPDIPRRAPVLFKRILCAVDFSDSSLSALAYALNLAEETDATLTLLHVIEMPPELGENALAADFDIGLLHAAADADARRRLHGLVPDQARAYCTVETAVVEGRPYRRLLQRAAEDRADLIVMGVLGRGAIDLLFFGSTTHHVIRAAPCPVLVVRG